jgi:CDP-glycerol glycerophosphotransferase
MKTSFIPKNGYALYFMMVSRTWEVARAQYQKENKRREMERLEVNKAVVLRLLEAIDKGKFDIWDEVTSLDYVNRFPSSGEPLTHKDHIQTNRLFYCAFQDLHHTIEDIFVALARSIVTVFKKKFNEDLKFFFVLVMDQVISLFSNFIPKNSNKVLFFSKPDYSDNAKYIYEKMLEMKLNNRLDLIWAVYTKVNVNNVRRRTLKYFYNILTAKYIISTHGVPHWKSKNQIAILTGHGLPFKASDYLARTNLINFSYKQRISLYITSKKINYLLSTSRLHAIILAAEWRLNMDKILITGFPRQDALYNKQAKKIASKFNIEKDKFYKLILYVPTFRDYNKDDLSSDILGNENFLKYLEVKNILLIYKPHLRVFAHSPRISELIIKFNHPNVIMLIDKDLIKEGIHLYEFLSVFDLIITDYSSIFYDATLLDIPIIFYVPDLETYSMDRGFIFEPSKWLPGHLTRNLDELLFALNKSNTSDPYRQKRNFIRDMMFDKKNGCSLRVINTLFHQFLEGT